VEGSAFFTERERAPLAWTEAVTLVSSDQAPDAIYGVARREFSDLTMAVIAINGWNRLAVGFRALAGTYEPAVSREAAKEG
jgi:alkylhydroperoxidase family enzyme